MIYVSFLWLISTLMYFSSYMTGWQMAVSLFRQFFDRRIRTDGCDSSTSCHGLRLSAWWPVLLRLHSITVGEYQGSPSKTVVNSENRLNGTQILLVRYGLFIISNESNTTDFFHCQYFFLYLLHSTWISVWMCFKQNVFNLGLDHVVSVYTLAYCVLLVNTEETNGTTLPFLCNIAKVGV